MSNRNENVIIENARLIFKNFSGGATAFNREGNRNFCVILEDEEVVDAMISDGWNIKFLKARDEDDADIAYIQVTVNYKNVPPEVYSILERRNGQKIKTMLNEDTIDSLDEVYITNVDLILRPYHWAVQGKEGVKAYLKKMYVTIDPDVLADKYADFDDM
ncbi:MAG: hypothetical protein ACRCTZ_09450 [Sarcina sp.]